MVYSFRCNSPLDESNKVLRKFDSVQRSTFEGILGVLLSDTSWDQAYLPINKTGVGIRRSADQVQAACVGSVFQSSVLVEKLTGHNPTEEISFVKAVEELSEIATTYPSQRKIQAELDNSAFDNLLGKQSSIWEKARLQSLSLPQSGAWLSAAPTPALDLHLSSIEFRVALKYRLGVKVYENERKCPFCKSGTLDVMGDHAVSCHGRVIWSLFMIVYETKLYQLARKLFCHPSLNRKVYYPTITPDRAISSCLYGIMVYQQL